MNNRLSSKLFTGNPAPWMKKGLRMKEPAIPDNSWKLFEKDYVEVFQGKHKGKRGKIKVVLRKSNQVTISGVNVGNKTLASKEGGGKIDKERPISYHHVCLLHPITGERTKSKLIKYHGEWTRVALPSGLEIPIIKAKENKENKENKYEASEKCTPLDVAVKKTFQWAMGSTRDQVLRCLNLTKDGRRHDFGSPTWPQNEPKITLKSPYVGPRTMDIAIKLNKVQKKV